MDPVISEMLGLDHRPPDPGYRGELSAGTREGDRISMSTLTTGVVMMPTTTNGVSRLITTGSEFISPDPVESGNGDRPTGSHGTVKDEMGPHGTVKVDKVPTSVIFHRYVSKNDDLPMTSSGFSTPVAENPRFRGDW